MKPELRIWRGLVCPKCGGKKRDGRSLACKACHTPVHPEKHGLSYTPEYRAWQTMRHRCTVPTNPRWEDYGGRGITICAGWLDSPAGFLADVGPRPSKNHELDRRDNNGGYWCGHCAECVSLAHPANCRWVTRKVNDRNRRNNSFVEYRGRKMVQAELLEQFGAPDITPARFRSRLVAGWELERALTTPGAKSSSRPSSKPRP
jgi:hypothetical protein